MNAKCKLPNAHERKMLSARPRSAAAAWKDMQPNSKAVRVKRLLR